MAVNTRGANTSIDVTADRGRKLTWGEIYGYALAAGFTAQQAKIATGIALAESSGYTKIRGDGGKSIGLWQIYTAVWKQFPISKLENPAYNARAAKHVHGKQGWGAWTMYNNKRYKAFLTPELARKNGAGWDNADKNIVQDIAVGPVGDAAEAGVDAMAAVAGFLKVLTHKDTWVRILKVGGGGIIILIAVSKLTDVPSPPIGKVAAKLSPRKV